MYKIVFYEISETCNARCKHCSTGRSNRAGIRPKSENVFVSIEDFKKTICYLEEKNFIDTSTEFHLYNWGEPTINPCFNEILRYLNFKNYPVVLATNFSKKLDFDPAKDDLSNIKQLSISMPGFSQNSYNEVHGFDFETIKQNIIYNLKSMRNSGFRGNAGISFHLYQFNYDEYVDALDFAMKYELTIYPKLAYINDREKALQYHTNSLPYEDLKIIGQDLILPRDFRNLSEADLSRHIDSSQYECSHFDCLTIDGYGNVLTCCSDSTIYKELTDVSTMQEVLDWKRNSDACEECMKSGLFAAIKIQSKNDNKYLSKLFPDMNRRVTSRFVDLKIKSKSIYEYLKSRNYHDIVIYGAGTQGKFLYSELKMSDIRVEFFIDRTANGLFDGIKILSLSEIEQFNTDLIVVACPAYYYREVVPAIDKLVGNSKTRVITMCDMLHEMENESHA